MVVISWVISFFILAIIHTNGIDASSSSSRAVGQMKTRLRGKGKGLVQLEAPALSSFPLTTFAGQQNEGGLSDGVLASEGRVSSPGGIWSDEWGNVYFSDTLAHTIMRVDKDSGVMRVVGGIGGRYGWNGDGSTSSQTLFSPTGVTGKKFEDKVIFCDTNNHVIRELSLSGGEGEALTTIAGQGRKKGQSGEGILATEALLSSPISVSVDSVGDVFIAELDRCTIRKVTAATGLISTIAGVAGSCGFSTGGAPTSQLLNGPRSVFVDVLGSVWIVDGGNKLIRCLTSDGELSIVSNGVNNEQEISSSAVFDPLSLWVDKSSNVLVSDVRGVVNAINVIDGSVSLYVSLNVSDVDLGLWQPGLYPVWGEQGSFNQLFVADSSSNRIMVAILPTPSPSATPTYVPSAIPSATPTAEPTYVPSATPTAEPTYVPSATPTAEPTYVPSATPTAEPTYVPSATPTAEPTYVPSATPTAEPTYVPSTTPTAEPTYVPSKIPTASPTATPTRNPSATPTALPTATPTRNPTTTPSTLPTVTPTASPTATPTRNPTVTPIPTRNPTATPIPTANPTATPIPTRNPTVTPVPTRNPTATPVPTADPTTADPDPKPKPKPKPKRKV